MVLLGYIYTKLSSLHKGEISDKEEIEKLIEQTREYYDQKYFELRKQQESDRMEIETKISTVNLAIQRKPKSSKENNYYGWG
jgi:hypothetical protein